MCVVPNANTQVLNPTRDPETGKRGLAPQWGRAFMARFLAARAGDPNALRGGMSGGSGATGPSPSYQARKQGV